MIDASFGLPQDARKRQTRTSVMLILLTNLYPFALMLVFLACLIVMPIPAKGRFAARTLGALVIAVALAHVNRTFYLWPSHLLFPSGHMTFCLAVSVSLGLLRLWTLALTLPLLVPFGCALVWLHFHTVGDVLGAIPLVLSLYGIAFRFWLRPEMSPPLDNSPPSP